MDNKKDTYFFKINYFDLFNIFFISSCLFIFCVVVFINGSFVIIISLIYLYGGICLFIFLISSHIASLILFASSLSQIFFMFSLSYTILQAKSESFNPFFSSGKGSCRLLTDKLTDYRSYQQLAGILTHREKIGDFGTEDIYAEVFGSTSYEESGATFILTSSVSSKKYAGLFDGWNDKAERNYLLCTQVGCSERGDAENIINALIGSVSNLAVSDGQTDLGWKTDTSAWFSSRPVPSLKRNSLFAELLYRIVYRDSLRIGICRNCGAPFLQSGIGSLNEVCSQACRMAQRRRKGLA